MIYFYQVPYDPIFLKHNLTLSKFAYVNWTNTEGSGNDKINANNTAALWSRLPNLLAYIWATQDWVTHTYVNASGQDWFK